MKKIEKLAKDIAGDLMEFGGEQSEVLSELIEITVREEELSDAERDALVAALRKLVVF